MALDISRLSSSMRAEWDSAQPIPSDLSTVQKALIGTARNEICTAFATAFINETTGHAVVNVTSVTGVQTGGGTSGPGTGTVS